MRCIARAFFCCIYLPSDLRFTYRPRFSYYATFAVLHTVPAGAFYYYQTPVYMNHYLIGYSYPFSAVQQVLCLRHHDPPSNFATPAGSAKHLLPAATTLPFYHDSLAWFFLPYSPTYLPCSSTLPSSFLHPLPHTTYLSLPLPLNLPHQISLPHHPFYCAV